MITCKYCKNDNVKEIIEIAKFTYKNKELEYSGKHLECPNCEREYITRDLIIENDSKSREAKKVADGLLTSSEILDARTKLDLTQEQASLVFGGGKNAFSKYERNEVAQSGAMDKLIRVCLENPSAFLKLSKDAGIITSHNIETIPTTYICTTKNVSRTNDSSLRSNTANLNSIEFVNEEFENIKNDIIPTANYKTPFLQSIIKSP